MDYLERYLDIYNDALDAIPSIYYLWEKAQPYVEKGDEKKIKKIENLIFLIHNSVVSPKTKLGEGVKFAYGGIGTVLHKDAVIGNGVAIGQGVTIGGSPGKFGTNNDGSRFFVPNIKDNVYIAAGCRVFGGVNIGKFSIIGANSVVVTDVEDFSVYVGQPASKKIKITKDNCLKYRSFFHYTKEAGKEEYMSYFPNA